VINTFSEWLVGIDLFSHEGRTVLVFDLGFFSCGIRLRGG
jgi:hypothetical protein